MKKKIRINIKQPHKKVMKTWRLRTKKNTHRVAIGSNGIFICALPLFMWEY